MGKDKPVLEGWLLKKKRKKMQGFAKRYFFLSQDGVLSYAVEPGSRIRDSVYVNLSSIATARSSKEFHVDSGSLVMHIKAHSEADFEKWTQALRKFVQGGGSKKNWGADGDKAKRRRRTAIIAGEGEDARTVDLSKMYHAVAKMRGPLSELEGVQEALKEDPQFSATNGDQPSGTTKKVAKKLFRKTGHGKDAEHGVDHATLLKQLSNAITALKTEHSSLVNAINASGSGFPSGGGAEDGDSAGGHGLGPAPESYASRRALGIGGGDTQDPDSGDEDEDGDESDGTFQSAEGGGGVFVDLDDLDDGSSKAGSPEPDEGGGPGDKIKRGSISLVGAVKTKVPGVGRRASEGPDSESDEDDSASEAEDAEDDELKQAERDDLAEDKVKRRDVLPHPVAGDEFSMFSMLKKNVGKDLSQVSFPVSFNEPLSALQKVAEECEYTSLLRKANAAKDPIDKIVYVTAFAISGFSSTKYRSSRKPFNPLLGETFECLRADKGLQFISEKVSHHPPIMAAYAQGKGWKLHIVSAARQKFWGKSLELIPEGSNKLEFEDGNVYTWEKPSSFVRNIMTGTKFLEHVGKLTVKNEKSGEKAEVEFKQGSSFGGESSRNKLDGKVLDANGKEACKLSGKWDEQVSRAMGGDQFQQILKVTDFPKDAPKYYGFTKFAIQLNEVTDDLEGKLPPTDSRLRPDQKAFEEGKVDEAEQGKKKLEEKQRAKRKEWNEQGKEPSPPQWFEEKGKEWVYKGGYFEKREEGKDEWEDLDIF